ncbi:MAG: RNA methyltransferase [Elusimicrobiota bacterium]
MRPRNPNNIGAAARAVSNFGFTDLRLVAPHEPVWREAKSAVGAEELLQRARVFETLQEALADRRGVWATSCLKARSPRRCVRDLPGMLLGPESAVVFGSEKTGLTSEDLRHCDGILRIPTHPDCPSMNLAQSVAIVCYELHRAEHSLRSRTDSAKCSDHPAQAEPDSGETSSSHARASPAARMELSGEEFSLLLDLSEETLLLIGWRPELGPQGRRKKLEAMLRDRGLTREEARLLFTLAKRVPRFCKIK